jgi:hypothetical protein
MSQAWRRTQLAEGRGGGIHAGLPLAWHLRASREWGARAIRLECGRQAWRPFPHRERAVPSLAALRRVELLYQRAQR